ncbi:MAG: SCO family protein [Alphaproteobacteria bacterium]|nr:SCO family protein [Alphaproteobacteria bacterium]
MTFPRVMLFVAATVIAVALGLTVNTLFIDEQGEVTSSGVGLPTIGGPFELVDHKGQAVTEADFGGSFMLVFFGYTYCPDVCPTELQVIGEAMDQLGKDGDKVRPLMVTIDPERDTVAVLADYIDNFHPSLTALTGSAEQIKAAARAYRVYYAKNPADEDGDYFMDHSSFVYLMGPDGKYLHHFSPMTTPEDMAAKVRAVISSG